MGMSGSGGGGGGGFAQSSTVQAAKVATAESTASTTYVDLTTAGPSVTISVGANGVLIVEMSATVQSSSTNNAAVMAPAISGANTIAAADTNDVIMVVVASLQNYTLSGEQVFTGLVAGSTTIKLQYRVGSGTVTFGPRSLKVTTY